MTRNAVESVNWLVLHKVPFRDWFLSNPENLTEELQRTVSGLDEGDTAAIARVVAESNQNALKYFKDINKDLERRYPRHPKPPGAV